MSEEQTISQCNFCRIAGELDTEDIPFWSKKSENYSPYPKMINCDPNYSLKNEELKEKDPELGENSLEAKLTLGKDNSNKYVYFWATGEQKNIHKILGPEEAYGKYENHGLKKCNDKGEVILKFNPPAPYKDKGETICKHIHYLLEGSDKTWLPLKTIRIICSISFEYLDKRVLAKDTIIINALSKKEYDKDHIPSSYNLPHESLVRLTMESKMRKVMNFVKSILKNYPVIEAQVRDKIINIRDVPIITYCARRECDLSEKLVDHLYECKFNNVSEWKGGIQEWNKKRSFFSDTSINEAEDDDDDDDDEGDADDDDDDEGDDDEEDEEDDEDEEDEEDDIIHESISYKYSGGILYDENLNKIGSVKVENNKIIEMDDQCKKYHLKQTETPEDDDDDEDDEDDDEDDEDDDEDDNDDDDGDEDDDEDDNDDDGDDDGDKFTTGMLDALKGGKGTLRNIIMKISERKSQSYSYGNIKNMNKSKLVELAITCQGKKLMKVKSDYKYRSDSEIEEMNEDDLRNMLNEMIKREPGTFKYPLSSWDRPTLVDFILTCQGSSKPKELHMATFVGGGWCL